MSRTDRLPSSCDIAVVGGGILGLAVARELLARRPDAEICLLEAEERLGAHQTSHNSGVIHAGVYYEPGSFRARLCVEGALSMESFCLEHDVPWRHAGKLIVATEERQLPRLEELERRGRANGVRDLDRLGPEQIEMIEPAARGLAALYSPFTGVTDFGRVAVAIAADFERRGGSIRTGATVIGVHSPAKARLHSLPRSPGGGRGIDIVTGRGNVAAGRAVFCAGLQADRLARLTGGAVEPRIVPVRGAYLRVVGDAGPLVRGNVYPVPDPALPFLGAHLTPAIDGSLTIGPTAMIVGARDAYRLTRIRARDVFQTASWPGTWRLIGRHPGAAVGELLSSVIRRRLVREATRLVPGLSDCRVLPGRAGVRAQALGRDGRLVDDFLLEETEGALHVRNAPSPAATSSFALAKVIAARLEAM